ncbi:Sodium/calcium exchanger protein-domain-containing protein [Mycena olivaceomarginata]|nr:Sodium/calcium exchanger protein-domain-containing protein [Mycena olivaceomarginata]
MTSELSPAQPTSGNSFTSRTTLVDNRETSPTRSGTGRLRGMEEGKSPVRPARRGKVAKVSMLQRVFNLCAAILSFFRSLPATFPTFFCATVPAFFRSLRKPAEEVGPIPGFKESLRAIVFNSWLNLLLFFIPVCWVLHWVTPQQYAAIFSTGFLAIIPLAKLLSFATDELSLRMAGTLAGLVNATLGNVLLKDLLQEDDPEIPQLNGWTCFGLMILVTVLVAITAEFLVGSIDGLTESGKISKEFVGMVLLPIVGNAAEHVSAVTVAVKDKMNLSIGVAVGSSIQIGLFVIPFSVLVAWGMDKPMTLLFDPFEAACLALAVVTVNYCVADGKSNWLEGMILMSLYAMLGTLFFCYTGVDVADHFATCT